MTPARWCRCGHGRPAHEPTTEEWRPVPGTDGRYEVSCHGRVRKQGSTRIRTGFRAAYGYYRHSIDGREEFRHTLIALAFIGPRPAGHQMRHLNGIAGDDRVNNLAWGTRSENAQDTIRHGANRNASRTRCWRGHEFTPENTRLEGLPERPRRRCLACEQIRHANAPKPTPKPRVRIVKERCPQGHSLLDPSNVLLGGGKRRCRTCKLEDTWRRRGKPKRLAA